MIYKTLIILGLTMLLGCSSQSYITTEKNIDLDRFMGDWYVIGGRTTYFEQDAYNAIERYSWNKEEKRIDVHYTQRDGSFDGEKDIFDQKAWIQNKESNAHWKIQFFWPFKFDYLILAVGDEYEWTAIGVPNKKYLWVMSRDWKMTDRQLSTILKKLEDLNYPTDDFKLVPQKW